MKLPAFLTYLLGGGALLGAGTVGVIGYQKYYKNEGASKAVQSRGSGGGSGATGSGVGNAPCTVTNTGSNDASWWENSTP